MKERQNSSFLTEMALLKSKMTLTPEERKEEVRRQMYIELRAMEMERRQRVAQETMEKFKREREERENGRQSLRRQTEENQEERMRHKAKKREEEERKANEQKALEKTKQDLLQKERLRWEKVMMVEEELVKWPRCTSSALKKEPRQDEAELCYLPKVGDKTDREFLTSDLKVKKKTLHNNWVGEQKPHSEPFKEKFHSKNSTYLLFAAKPGPKPKEKTETPKFTETLLKVGHWVDKYRHHREMKNEKRRLKAEEQYARWTAFKMSQAGQFPRQYDCYTQGFATSRNNILKSIF
ncbi:capping protein inhibiting regulator of actin dynamics-like isoform X2 [Micropterus dolomieu]|uniref:capping protein inhibiting regulator of actin dynamics-like isoform X1 n=1 Tax=Micropterus dolomieu TaxID=147949 RepID=UPI001E8CF010|nr:capping protein inhibiting regulator of actin dynamics-like isoform X1 [Micropterus dolomieu]XP_045906908.1 capping protein inhibiting regulator of actin dynamics-like isoform X2 [Micropterus dolomieu]